MGEDSVARWRARAALIERQRTLDWQLARADGRAAGMMLGREHVHDLRNVVQVLELGLLGLTRRGIAGDDDTRELLAALVTTVADGKRTLEQISHAPVTGAIASGAPVASALDAALARVRPALPADVVLDAHVAIDAATYTACSADELEQLVVALVLTAGAVDAERGTISLTARTRRIDGRPWVELMMQDVAADGAAATLPVTIALIAERAGGEATVSPTRDGGVELVIALPVAHDAR